MADIVVTRYEHHHHALMHTRKTDTVSVDASAEIFLNPSSQTDTRIAIRCACITIAHHNVIFEMPGFIVKVHLRHQARTHKLTLMNRHGKSSERYLQGNHKLQIRHMLSLSLRFLPFLLLSFGIPDIEYVFYLIAFHLSFPPRKTDSGTLFFSNYTV